MMTRQDLPDLLDSEKRRATRSEDPLTARVEAPTVDLAAVLAELVGVRSELRQQTLASRELREHSADTLEVLRETVSKNDEAATRSAENAFVDRVRVMIAIADSLEPSIREAKKLAEPRRRFWKKRTNPRAEALVSALELTQRRIVTELSALEVHRIETENRAFDPGTMEATEAIADSGAPGGTVLEELMAGYKGPKSIIRYAQVVVAR